MGKNDLNASINKDENKLGVSRMQRRLERIYLGGGKSKIEKQHSRGKLTARERIDYLIDDNSFFFEIGAFAGYGMYKEHGGAPAGGVVTVSYTHLTLPTILLV